MSRNPAWLATFSLALLLLPSTPPVHAQDPGRSCATVVALPTDLRLGGSVELDNPYRYRVHLDAGHVYNLDAQLTYRSFEASADPGFVIRSADCLDEVLPIYPLTSPGPIIFRAPSTGEFILQAFARPGYGDLASSFSVQLTDRGAVPDDFPDSPAGAPLLTGDFVGAWEYEADVDYALVDLLPGRQYRFEFTRTAFDARGREVSPYEYQYFIARRVDAAPAYFELRLRADAGGAFLPETLLVGPNSAGRYALGMTPPSRTAAGTYRLRIIDAGPSGFSSAPGAPGSSCENPLPFLLDGPRRLLRADVLQDLWLSVPARAGQVLGINLYNYDLVDPAALPSLNGVFSVRGVFAPGCGPEPFADGQFIGSFLVPADGTYLIRLTVESGYAAAAYVQIVTRDEHDRLARPDDFPNVLANPPLTPLVGDRVPVRSDSSVDIDCFSVQLVPGGVYAVSAETGGEPRLTYVYREVEGALRHQTYFSASEAPRIIALPPSSVGRLAIATLGGSSPLHAIRFVRLDVPEALSQDCAAPTPLILSAPPKLFTQRAPFGAARLRFVSFPVRAGNLYSPEIAATGDFDDAWTPTAWFTSLLSAGSACSDQRRPFSPFVALADGLATIVLELHDTPGAEAVFISLAAHDLGPTADRIGDTADTGMRINPDDFEITSTIDHGGDADAFIATLDPTATYRIELQSLDPAHRVSVDFGAARPVPPRDQHYVGLTTDSAAPAVTTLRVEELRAREFKFAVLGDVRDLGAPVTIPYRLRISRASCPADFGHDGLVTPDDLADFIAAFFSSPPDARADFNADGEIDPEDLGMFIEAYSAGC